MHELSNLFTCEHTNDQPFKNEKCRNNVDSLQCKMKFFFTCECNIKFDIALKIITKQDINYRHHVVRGKIDNKLRWEFIIGKEINK